MDQSTAYIRAVLLGLLATMLYNGCASILRAVGDTTAPLLFLLFAAVLNVALDLLFILKFGFGVCRRCLGHCIIPVAFRAHKPGLYV